MAENKTKPTDQPVAEFLDSIEDERKRADSRILAALLQEVTQAEPKMWGNMVGFGDLHYRYASGREGDWFLAGFAPRKQNLTLYITGGFNQFPDLLEKLGKHSLGKGCLYIKKVADIDLSVLRTLLERTLATDQNQESKSA
jgi:hypothetical protein